ncbi:MAG: YHS domain-containing protein [bacterium]
MTHQATAAGSVTDPVCGMTIDSASAFGHAEYLGQTYYFCSAACQTRFNAEPARYAGDGTARADA